MMTTEEWNDKPTRTELAPAEQMREAAAKVAGEYWATFIKPEFWPRHIAAAIRALPLPPEPEPHPYVPDSFDALITSARQEAIKAMRKFPQPNYVISKVAEEAGEVVKAAIHCAEGRDTFISVRGEMKQLIAMLYRLWVEGDGVHGLASVGDDPHPINNLPPEPEPPIVAKLEATLRIIADTWPDEYSVFHISSMCNNDLAELAAWREGRKG